MLFSPAAELGLVIIGLLYVANKWFDSFIDIIDTMKNNEPAPMSESVKKMYS